MGTLAAKIMKIMKGLYNRNTAPIYVKIILLNLEICANFHKTIRDDYDKIMCTWAAKILYNRNTAPIYVKILLLYLEICANFRKSIRDDNDKIMGT
mgnify:CR=1 FL=1